MFQKTWKLSIPSNPEKIVDVEEFLNNIFSEEKWNDDIQANVGIAVTEIVNNAILHGNESDESKEVNIKIMSTQSWIEIHVKDQGKCCEGIDVPDPTKPENLLKTNGRGLFLVEHFMDEISVIPSETGTTISMKLNIAN